MKHGFTTPRLASPQLRSTGLATFAPHSFHRIASHRIASRRVASRRIAAPIAIADAPSLDTLAIGLDLRRAASDPPPSSLLPLSGYTCSIINHPEPVCRLVCVRAALCSSTSICSSTRPARVTASAAGPFSLSTAAGRFPSPPPALRLLLNPTQHTHRPICANQELGEGQPLAKNALFLWDRPVLLRVFMIKLPSSSPSSSSPLLTRHFRLDRPRRVAGNPSNAAAGTVPTQPDPQRRYTTTPPHRHVGRVFITRWGIHPCRGNI